MKSEINSKSWFVIVILVTIPTIYFFFHLTDNTFADNAMGNWFATMVGAVCGIFIALELDRLQKRSEEKSQTRKILMLVKDELQENLTYIRNRLSDDNPQRFNPYRLKDELWNAISDGGELQWIKDLDLLNHISSAYYFIRIIISLEDKYFDAIHYQGGVWNSTRGNILSYLTQIDSQAINKIETALTEIEKRIK